MPRCIALKVNGEQCARNAAGGGTHCAPHDRIHAQKLEQAGPELEDRCNHFMKRVGRWSRCGRARTPEQQTCHLHGNMIERRGELRRMRDQRMREARERIQRVITDLVATYTARHQAGETLDTIIEHLTNEAQVGNVSWHVRHVILFHLADLIPGVDIHTARENMRVLAMQVLMRHHRARLEQGPARPPCRLNNDLAGFVADRQNVHRSPISEQTNRGMEILLRQPTPMHARTCQTILGYWMLSMTEPVRNILRVYDDMYHWYSRDTCRAEGDHLYHRMIDGLWTLIYTRILENPQIGVELVRRLYEECRDSVSTCCEGHLTRVVNVMVGFDDAFQTPQSRSEILGQKFSAIQNSTVPLDEKKQQATRVLDELGVPLEERAQWINAIE